MHRLVIDISTDRYKPPSAKTVAIKLDYLVDQGDSRLELEEGTRL